MIEHRPYLLSIAYRMLGSVADAEDAVQEALIRGEAAGTLDSPRAWLATVTTRICLDQLKSAHKKREKYVGQWLPEPLRTDDPRMPLKVRGVEDVESLSMAFLVLLETLTPLERAAFLLHDVFDYEHEEIAEILEREQASVRQLVSRARAHVREGRPRFSADPDLHRTLLGQFFNAVALGDVTEIERVLAKDAVLVSDGGGQVRAALKPIEGSDKIARFMVGVATKMAAGAVCEVIEVNGTPALVWTIDGLPVGVLVVAISEKGIEQVHIALNPEKLAGLSPR